ncbi:MAG: hypothetical protein Q9185_004504 [Variospora sp. 1 TL-2023]
MAPPRLVFIAVLALILTLALTFASLVHSHPRQYTANGSPSSTQQNNFRSFFSFRTPSALFPSSAIISLTDDNSTFFLARPAEFGPRLPADGLSAQLWVGSGFGDVSFGRGLGTETEGELGCSDVPGWRDGWKYHQGDGQFEPSEQVEMTRSGHTNAKSSVGQHSESSIQDMRRHQGLGSGNELPQNDGTDDHLHYPLPASEVSQPTHPGRAAGVQHDATGKTAPHADIQSLQEGAEISGKLVMLSRGGCGFLEKVKWVQRRGGAGLIVGDNTRGGALVTMYAKGDTSNVTIPALFTSHMTAHLLSSLIPPEALDNGGVSSASASAGTSSGRQQINADLSEDRPTFTPSAFVPRSTSSLSGKAYARQPVNQDIGGSRNDRSRGSWLVSIFRREAKDRANPYANGVEADSRRPPSSGRLTWVNEKWTESAIAPGKDRREPNHENTQRRPLHEQDNIYASDEHDPGDGFEIGVHDWRDPDLVGAKLAKSSAVSTSKISMSGPSTTGRSHGSDDFDDVKKLSGGSITPSSGEYQKPADSGKSKHSSSNGAHPVPESNVQNAPGWFGNLLSGGREKVVTRKPSGKHEHEGLWVTLTPTTMSTSPFFDTLLVLVVSPLITLTVVYSLLLIRSRIRRRRWRAPKSVVDRLPIRTYHTMSCSSTTSSSQLATPIASSPTSPLLHHSPRSSIISRPQPRSRAASDIHHAVTHSLEEVTARASIKPKDTATENNARKSQYHGKQVECVVCLEEYVDGQSKVMSLPCGHEFHAECITPWLTTRRRTCPICKGDVVRSMGRPGHRSSNQPTQPGSVIVANGDELQVQAAETTNDSPTAAIPIPHGSEDLERGDDMAATLVNDRPEASSSRRGWRGFASFSLSAFSGEAAWRQAQADRDR